jgi:hypothetical protein
MNVKLRPLALDRKALLHGTIATRTITTQNSKGTGLEP